MLEKGLLVVLAAALSLAAGLGAAELETGRDSGTGAGAGEQRTTRSGDEIYRGCLRALDQARAALEQHPADLAAQARPAAELAKKLEELKQAVQRPPASPSASQRTAQPGKATASPSGPVTPSSAASREEDERRRREATLEKFLPGPPLGDPEKESLAGVPSSWILESADAALVQVAELRRGLAAGGMHPAAIRKALGALQAELDRMRCPE